MSLELLACATAYEPTPQQARALVNQLSRWGARAVIYDNTRTPATARSLHDACTGAGIRYLGGRGDNLGTAGALNQLLKLAEREGAGWLLYFDQDSRISPEYVERTDVLLQGIHDDVALIGSRIVQPGGYEFVSSSDIPWREARFVISSGTLMRVSALLAVDGFDELLGLDLVDHDVCLRVRQKGFGIGIDNSRWVQQEIGRDSRLIQILGIRVTRHPWWRRHDMWRNSMILVRRYARTAPSECIRHLLGRVMETIAAAAAFRDVRYLTAAVSGAREGLRIPVAPISASQLEFPNPHRWQPPEGRVRADYR